MDINNGLLLCFGNSGTASPSNNFIVTFAVSFNNIISVVLGQTAKTEADGHANYWDISVGGISNTQLHLWARKGNTPGYYYLAIGY